MNTGIRITTNKRGIGMKKIIKIYNKIDLIPRGNATAHIEEGCIVLEGGAFRGVYTSGVLDAFMKCGINMQTTIGVSAGALNGYNYVAGQIGRSARINLMYRHYSEYVGIKAIRKNKGVIGFNFVMNDINQTFDIFNRNRFNNPNRRFVAVATNLNTGKAAFFDKGENINKAVQASATMPFVSVPVIIDNEPYMDGGCADRIPFEYAKNEGFKKIIVVRTRSKEYRKKLHGTRYEKMVDRIYGDYPNFCASLKSSSVDYNRECEELIKLHNDGELFCLWPSKPVTIARLEGNMNKLGELYWRGFKDGMEAVPKIKEYLKSK